MDSKNLSVGFVCSCLWIICDLSVALFDSSVSICDLSVVLVMIIKITLNEICNTLAFYKLRYIHAMKANYFIGDE